MSRTRSPRREAEGVRIVAVGVMRGAAEEGVATLMARRIRPAITVFEVPDAKGSPAEMRRREADAIRSALGGAAYVALDQGGEMLDSAAFSRRLERALAVGNATFVLGGAEGLDPLVTAGAAWVLSLGPMTWPHRLARAMLLEQIFRARCIATGHPYHRGERP